MHLDGMKQEEVGKSNLLGPVVAVCLRSSRNTRKLHFTLWVFTFFFNKNKKYRKDEENFYFLFNCNQY